MALKEITPGVLVAVVGAIVSVVFTYFPGLREKFAALESAKKSLIMLGLLLVVSAAIFGLGCWGVLAQWGYQLTCDINGGWQLLTVIALVVTGNQIAYLIFPQPESVRRNKALRE